MSRIEILLFLTIFTPTFAAVSLECRQHFENFKHPFNCCKYPMRKILAVDQENCKMKCKEKPNDDGCCDIDCIYRETGVILKGVFNAHAVMKLYENYLEENGAGKYDVWVPIVERSIQKCVELIPKSDKIYTCNVPEYILDIINCVSKMNFLNCPSFQQSAKCVETREMMKNLDKCGTERNGTFFPSEEIWDFEVIDLRDLIGRRNR